MIVDELFARRSRVVEAVTALAEHLTVLLACADVLDSEGHGTAAREVRRALMRATTALHVMREELVVLEIVEGYLRTQAEDREPPPRS